MIVVRRVFKAIVVFGPIFLGVNLLLPQLAGLRNTAEQLASATWWLPLAAILLQVARFGAYSELQLVALRAGGEDAPRNLVHRATVASASLGKTLPGGTTTALALTIRALRANGISGARATVAIAASGAISSGALAAMMPLAALAAVLGGRAGGVAMGSLMIALGVVAVVAVLPFAVRNPEGVGTFVERRLDGLLPGFVRRWVPPASVGGTVTTALHSAAALFRDPRSLFTSLGWAAGAWLADLASLAVVAVTIGEGTSLFALPLAYVIGQLLAAVPITPGGVGVVEAGMTGALVAAGSTGAGAAATVLGWRLVSHWLPIVVGLTLVPSLQRGRTSEEA